eukprot:30058_1
MALSKEIGTKTEYLVIGYVREIHIKINNEIIPADILKLCIEFYPSKIPKILFLKGQHWDSDNIDFVPEITTFYVNEKRSYKHTVQPLEKMYHVFRHYNCGIRYVKDFKLPNSVLSSFDGNGESYDVIFVVSNVRSYASIAYIIDHENDKTYSWKLPYFDWDVGSVVYSRDLNELYTFGHKYKKGSFNVLSFNESELKWKQKGIMERPRTGLSATMISDNKAIICGGYTTSGFGYSSDADIYDFNDKTWIKGISSMNDGRDMMGIYYDAFIDNHRVYVGGGRDGTRRYNKFEYYDINKNKWFRLPDADGNYQHPVIWSEYVNILHAVSHVTESHPKSKLFEQLDLRENKWHIYVKQDQFDDLIGMDTQKGNNYIRLCFSE